MDNCGHRFLQRDFESKAEDWSVVSINEMDKYETLIGGNYICDKCGKIIIIHVASAYPKRKEIGNGKD